jgi:hypothetical protein
VIDVLGGFVRLGRRPETLFGTISVRASTCKPFTDGNRSGVHVWFSQPVMLSRAPELPDLQMTDELCRLVFDGYEARLADLTARGLLARSGHWQDRLNEGPIVRKNGITSIWTGLLVRPEPGLWLLSTGARNRRPWVEVRDCVIGSDAGYTPLILELELETMPSDTMWIEAEIATLLPLRPDVSFTKNGIAERPELGRRHNQFYTPEYLKTREGGKSVGRYRKALGQISPAEEAGASATCQLVHVAGPDTNTIETFSSVVGPEGELADEVSRRLQFAVLRNMTPLQFDFDGLQFHLLNEDADPHADDLLRVWRDLFGEAHLPAIEWWSQYFMPNGQDGLGQQVLLLISYTFVETPAGWSSVGDGIHYAGLAGQRGVVATDVFHHVGGAVLVPRAPGEFRIEAGAPLMRVLPVPRSLLSGDYRVVELDRA